MIAAKHGRRDYIHRRIIAAADLAGVATAYVVVFVVLGGIQSPTEALWALPTLPFWLLVFKAYGLYERDIKRISHTTIDDLPSLFHAMLLGGLLVWAYYWVFPVDKLVFSQVLLFGAVAIVLILCLRGIARSASLALLGPERMVVIGDSPASAALVHKTRSHPEYGQTPVGYIAASQRDGEPEHVRFLLRLTDLDNLDLAALVAEHRIDRLVIARNEVDESALLPLVRECKPLMVKVSILPPLFDAMGPSVEIDDVEGITVLGINPPVLSRSSRMLKRALDIVVAGTMLVLFAPVFLAVAIAVRVGSRGRVFFRQERVGRDDNRFRLWKFRTMVADAEARRASLLGLSEDTGWLKIESDPRITRVGRFLRFTSLDELPQLFNVLKGDMSLVGPRPLIPEEHEQIQGWGRSRLDLTPGVTGLWQVLGRTNIPFEEMVKLDYLYVTNWSLWADVRLMLQTLPVVVSRRGVN